MHSIYKQSLDKERIILVYDAIDKYPLLSKGIVIIGTLDNRVAFYADEPFNPQQPK
jgi:hypothetical protein